MQRLKDGEVIDTDKCKSIDTQDTLILIKDTEAKSSPKPTEIKSYEEFW